MGLQMLGVVLWWEREVNQQALGRKSQKVLAKAKLEVSNWPPARQAVGERRAPESTIPEAADDRLLPGHQARGLTPNGGIAVVSA